MFQRQENIQRNIQLLFAISVILTVLHFLMHLTKKNFHDFYGYIRKQVNYLSFALFVNAIFNMDTTKSIQSIMNINKIIQRFNPKI